MHLPMCLIVGLADTHDGNVGIIGINRLKNIIVKNVEGVALAALTYNYDVVGHCGAGRFRSRFPC